MLTFFIRNFLNFWSINLKIKKKKSLDEKFKKNYLAKYKFYSLNDRKFRFCRDKIISKKNYEEIMIDMMKRK